MTRLAGRQLAACLRAGLDQDEALALAVQAAAPGTWHAAGEDIVTANPDPHWNGVCVASASGAEAAHIVRHDPARAILDVTAGRAILDAYERALDAEHIAIRDITGNPAPPELPWLETVCQHLATAYEDT